MSLDKTPTRSILKFRQATWDPPPWQGLIQRGASVWRKSRFKLIENSKSDLIWLFLHRVIRVRDSLKTWGYINNDKCVLCGRVETIEHCLLTCPRATRVWLLFAAMITALTDVPLLPTPLSVLYPLNLHPSTTGFRIAHYLIATILYWIWIARNLATFRNRVLSSLSIAYLIKLIVCAVSPSGQSGIFGPSGGFSALLTLLVNVPCSLHFRSAGYTSSVLVLRSSS